jgi:hypothetical protein
VYEDIYKILETDMNSKLNYLKSNLFIAWIEMIEWIAFCFKIILKIKLNYWMQK